MKNISTFLIAFYFTFAFALIYAQPPQNLTFAKRAVIKYYQSGEYEQDVNVIVQKAENYLLKRINENNSALNPRKLAVILDIDDTSLSNFEGNKKRDFSGLPEFIDASYQQANAPAIKPVLRLFNTALRNSVDIFFITFRPATFRAYTIINLHKAGYYGWHELYLPNREELKLPAQVYKTGMRKMLNDQGYQIILNLGDQDSDLSGGYAEYTALIPNPLYSH